MNVVNLLITQAEVLAEKKISRLNLRDIIGIF
jgi:hypothetical protein